jgi:hypothetical protein
MERTARGVHCRPQSLGGDRSAADQLRKKFPKLAVLTLDT